MLSQFNGVPNKQEMIRAKCENDKLKVLAWLQFYFNRQQHSWKPFKGLKFATFRLRSILNVMMAKNSTNCLLYFSFLLLACMICSTNGYQPTGSAKKDVSFLYKLWRIIILTTPFSPFSFTVEKFYKIS